MVSLAQNLKSLSKNPVFVARRHHRLATCFFGPFPPTAVDPNISSSEANSLQTSIQFETPEPLNCGTLKLPKAPNKPLQTHMGSSLNLASPLGGDLFVGTSKGILIKKMTQIISWQT